MIPLITLFFLTNPGKEKETLNLTSLLGMIFVIGGTLWFIHADKEQREILDKEEELKLKKKELGEKSEEEEPMFEKEIVVAPTTKNNESM